MAEKSKRLPTVLHPFLLAAYPVLALLAYNTSQISINSALRSLLIMMLGALILFFILFRALRDRGRAGLVTSLWLVLFSSYGHVYQSLSGVSIGSVLLRRHTYLLPLWLLIGTVLTILIVRSAGTALNLTRALNLVGMAAVFLPLVQIGIYVIRPGGGADLFASPKAPQVNTLVPQGETPPDVYYIILDMYTREDILREAFHFDNTVFINELKDLGFYVAPCSRSNYVSTELSISSSLNMDYYQDLFGDQGSVNLSGWIHQSAVKHAFDTAGYTSIAFDSGYSPTTIRDVDQYLGADQSILNTLSFRGANAFEGMLLKSTMGILVYDYSTKFELKPQAILDGAYITHRERILFTLDKLPELASQPGAKFVFAHILAPHEPFVFDQDGNFASRNRPFTLNGDMEYTTDSYAQGYADQITYLNKRVIALIRQIQQDSAKPPVIIIQGDHGSHRTGIPGGDTPILNAYYLPGKAKDKLFATISPVNSFRLVFNEYLGADLPLLPDQSYLSDHQNPYDFTPVNEPSSSCAP